MGDSVVPFAAELLLPPEFSQVTNVIQTSADAADWQFDRPVTVTDPNAVGQLVIDGQPGLLVIGSGPQDVEIQYPGPVGVGDPWDVVGVAPGLSPPPEPGQSGVVSV